MPEKSRYPDGPSWRERSPWSPRWEFNRWGKQVLSNLPGGIGSFLRRHFYGFGACGRDNLLMEGLWVEYPHRLFVGEHCNINRGCFINAGGGVTIGDWVLIGPHVTIYSQNHIFDAIDVPVSMAPDKRAPVVIEDDAWIGTNVVIVPGARVGEGAVVAAGAVVTHDIEPRSMVAGVPARHVRFRDEPHVHVPPGEAAVGE